MLATPAMASLPTPSQLAGLGTVLCLYRAGGELGGWSRAVRAEAGAALHSDGPDECIAFRDGAGDCCWKLYLLPDSDFLAWERLLSSLPPQGRDGEAAGIGERLLRGLAGRLRAGQWQGSVLRLHALNVSPGMSTRDMLAASLAPVSSVSAAAARRIARYEGADATALADDCCCLRAARTAAAAERAHEAYPLIRLHAKTNE